MAKFAVNFTADFSEEEYRSLMGIFEYPKSACDADVEGEFELDYSDDVVDPENLKCYDDLDPIDEFDELDELDDVNDPY